MPDDLIQLKAMFYDIMVLRHPGHGNQKVHGNRQSTSQGDVDKAAAKWYKDQKKPSYDHPNSKIGGYTATQTRENFDTVASKLADETGISKDTIKDYAVDWGKSGGHGEKFDSLQKSADKIFNGIDDNSEAGKLVKQMHKNTQNELKKAGIKDIVLYRGDSGKAKGNLKSWTLDPKAAAQYAKNSGGRITKRKFSADKIVSTPFTGIGNIGDFEFVVFE